MFVVVASVGATVVFYCVDPILSLVVTDRVEYVNGGTDQGE